MLGLDDDKVCDFLYAKGNGDNPSYFIFQYSYEFIMSLKR